MSKSVKLPRYKRSATNSSTAAERKLALFIIKDVQRQTRRQYTAEEKIRVVLEGLQGEQSMAEICRRERLNTNIYYCWNGPPWRLRRVGRSSLSTLHNYHRLKVAASRS